MENFRRNNSQGGWKGGNNKGYGGGKRFGNGGGFDDRGFMKPTLHRATCAQCGNSCEVPFKPNGSKPVYCRDCFKKDEGGAPQKFGGDKRFGAPSFPEKRMYEAVCEGCGDECEVPFRPSGERPVYCRACFGGKKNDGATDYKSFKSSAPAEGASKEQLARIESKLDAIMKALNLAKAPEAPAPKAAEKPVVATAATEEAPKKAAKKKAAPKKKK